MTKYIVLGLVQGITEFLPVSSSAHLVFFQKMLGVDVQGLVLALVLHLGTLAATVVFFRRRIIRFFTDRGNLFLVVVVTLLTGVIALPAKGLVESLFVSPRCAALALLVSGAVLIFTRKFSRGGRQGLSPSDGVVMGTAQAIAVIPGISRSGITIASLLFRGVDKAVAFEFSFLASLPVIAGAAILDGKDILSACDQSGLALLAGFIASFGSGLLALALLKRVIIRSGFHYFGYYCFFAACAALIFLR